jgi:biofilm PGA synthesis lipoprotein PgaB
MKVHKTVAPYGEERGPELIGSLIIGTLLSILGQQSALADAVPSHLTVLQYHHVSSSTPASTSISPEQFNEHLLWLEDNNFQVVPLAEALAKIQAGKTLPDKTVAITFDDGYLDNYATAFPLLRQRNWPFTVFINSAPHDAGRTGWASWEQLREMSAAGASIANHTTFHGFLIRRKDGESKADWLERIRLDIEFAERRIKEETNQSHKILAYPYGESNQEIRQLVTEMGFTAFGQQSGPVGASSNFTDLPRFPLSGIYSLLDTFKTKMLSLPMEVKRATPISASGDNTLAYSEGRPVLMLQLATKEHNSLNCFASGQGAIPVEPKGEGIYEIQAPMDISSGRSRYNCTHSSKWPGRFYWYSYAWVRRNSDGIWSHQ